MDVVKEGLKNNETLGERTDWEVEDISNLPDLFKTLDGKVYFQRDGLPIGKSISKPMAGIYMHWFEKEYVFNEDSRFKGNIVFWKRQMDDVFFVWRGKKEDLELFVWMLNGKENRVQFTLEIEKDNFLPFLDVGITKSKGKLITTVYRKPTHTQQYIHWNSNHPKNMLLGVLKGLIHRAHVLCDRKEDLLEELELLKNVFISNGYPEKLVLKTMKESWAKETLKAVLVGIEQEVEVITREKAFFEVLHAPYVKGFTEGLQRSLRELNIGVVPKKGETLYSHVCKLKQKKEKDEHKDVIYSVPCGTCGVRYVGETGQHYCDRRSQHQRDIKNKKVTNGFYSHMKKSGGHQIEWGKCVFLDKEKNWRRRKIKEAIYINAINPTESMVHQDILNLEKGYDFDPIWGGFNQDFRGIIEKRIQSAKV